MPSPHGTLAMIPLCLGLCWGCTAGPSSEAQGPETPVAPAPSAPARNPFGVEDLPDCCGAAAHAFADEAPPRGTAEDINAETWVTPPAEHFDSIEGEWAARWDTGGVPPWTQGRATIRVAGERVFILYRDDLVPIGGYLAEAERQGHRLVGAFRSLDHADDHGYWVGTIVDSTRIDGIWERGRWDFRRGTTHGRGSEAPGEPAPNGSPRAVNDST